MKIVSLIALVICIAILCNHLVRIIRLGKPKDLSEPSGSVTEGVIYSNTIAMMPQNKESAYMHIPTYAAGMIFHIGTFLAILLYFLSFTPLLSMWPTFWHILGIGFAVSACCGFSLLLKRCVNKNLKVMSNPDDYLSNLFTTLFHVVTVLLLCFNDSQWVNTVYYLEVTLLLLYLPLGKLKHLLYYFSARYHLGFFYGWRNVWPIKKNK